MFDILSSSETRHWTDPEFAKTHISCC